MKYVSRFRWQAGPRTQTAMRWLTLAWSAMFELLLLSGLFLAVLGRWPSEPAELRPGNLVWFSEAIFLPTWYVLIVIGLLLGLVSYALRFNPFTFTINVASLRPWQRFLWQAVTAEPLAPTERRLVMAWALISLLFVLLFPLAFTRVFVQLGVQLLAIAESAVILFAFWQASVRTVRWVRRNPQQLVNAPLNALLRFILNNRGRP